MVEGQNLIEKRQARVRDLKLVLRQLGQALDLPHCVIRKEAHGASSKGWHPRKPSRLVTAESFAQHLEDIPLDMRRPLALGDRNAAATRYDPLVWIEPDERIAANLLSAFHRLQQEAL